MVIIHLAVKITKIERQVIFELHRLWLSSKEYLKCHVKVCLCNFALYSPCIDILSMKFSCTVTELLIFYHAIAIAVILFILIPNLFLHSLKVKSNEAIQVGNWMVFKIRIVRRGIHERCRYKTTTQNIPLQPCFIYQYIYFLLFNTKDIFYNS